MKALKISCVALGLVVWPFIVIPVWLHFHSRRYNDMEGIQFALPAMLTWIAAFFMAIYGAFFVEKASSEVVVWRRHLGRGICFVILGFLVFVVAFQVLRAYHLGDWFT